jgi:tRNA(Arg) A34 adenosine deaminase TadA
MNNIIKMLNAALKASQLKSDDRVFRVGSIAVRGDGTIVRSYNGNPLAPEPKHHSEARLCRKLDRDATVFVARSLANGMWSMSKPCENCMRAMRRSYVKRIYYTISHMEYGTIYL